MTPLEATLRAIQRLRWKVVLLEPGTKRLAVGSVWTPIDDWDTICGHLRAGGGIGLDVFESGVVVLDFDGAMDGVIEKVCPVPITATSPSGGVHAYFRRPEIELPATIFWRGERLGEVLRAPRQQVVLPPSPYPGNVKRGVPPGGFYSWVDLPESLPELPDPWIKYLIGDTDDDIPSFIGRNRRGQPSPETWTGPSPSEIISEALKQPGARRRANGIKFQCPQCARDGHDRHRDNAVVLLDGRWGCAYAPGDPTHRNAIGVALKAVLPTQPVHYETMEVKNVEEEPTEVNTDEMTITMEAFDGLGEM